MIRALSVSLAIFFTVAADAQELKCEMREKYVCEAGGCKPAPAKVWNLVDTARRTYARCDSAGCDKYDAQFAASGAFINVDVPGRGVIAKMAVDGSSFHEIAALTHVIYVSFGSCKRT